MFAVASARRTENNTTTDTTETPNVVYLEEKPYKRCNRKRKSMKSEKSKRKSKTKIAKKKVRCFNNVNMDPLYTSEILIKTEQTDDEELIGQSSRYNNPTHIDDMFDDKDADFVLESDKDDEPLIMLRKKRGRPAKYPPRDDLFDDRRRKEPRPIICGSLCKQKCAEKFTEKQRILMCDHYWNLNREKRIDYIRSHTKAKRSIRLRRRGECKRNNVCVYYLEDVALQNAALIRVCRSYFEATLRLSHYDIKKALDGFELQPELEVKPMIIETKESRNYRNQYTKRKEVEQTLDPVTGNLVPLYACASENITNLSSTDGSKLKKKRIRRDPTQPVARSPRPINCAERCIYKCHTKFTEEQRQQICSNFWTMDYKRRKDFILSRVETREILYETTPEFRKSNRPPRTYHTRFYLRAGLHGENQRVCKSFMMATLRIGHHFISNALQFADQTTGYYTGGDRRGQHTPGNKISSERIEEIKQHIAAYPTWMPNKKSKTRYLHSSLSIKRLYIDYKEKCIAEQKKFVSSNFFYGIFHNDFKLAFLKPIAAKEENVGNKGFINSNPHISNYTGEEPGGYWSNSKGDKLNPLINNLVTPCSLSTFHQIPNVMPTVSSSSLCLSQTSSSTSYNQPINYSSHLENYGSSLSVNQVLTSTLARPESFNQPLFEASHTASNIFRML